MEKRVDDPDPDWPEWSNAKSGNAKDLIKYCVQEPYKLGVINMLITYYTIMPIRYRIIMQTPSR